MHVYKRWYDENDKNENDKQNKKWEYLWMLDFFSATSDEEMTMWVKGLNWLVADTLKSPTPLQIER